MVCNIFFRFNLKHRGREKHPDCGGNQHLGLEGAYITNIGRLEHQKQDAKYANEQELVD